MAHATKRLRPTFSADARHAAARPLSSRARGGVALLSLLAIIGVAPTVEAQAELSGTFIDYLGVRDNGVMLNVANRSMRYSESGAAPFSCDVWHPGQPVYQMTLRATRADTPASERQWVNAQTFATTTEIPTRAGGATTVAGRTITWGGRASDGVGPLLMQLDVDVTYRFAADVRFVLQEVLVTNTGAGPLRDIYFMVNGDPDHGQCNIGSSFDTINDVRRQPTEAIPSALVTARAGTTTQVTMGIGAHDPRARAHVNPSGLLNTDPVGTWASPNDSGGANEDVSIGLVFRDEGSLAVGESRRFVFAYVWGPTEPTVEDRFDELECSLIPEGAPCGSGAGRCRAGACCVGCWTGSACQPGTAFGVCGAAGALCEDCDDGNACTTNECAGGGCGAVAVAAGVACPDDGVCDGSGLCVDCVEPDDCADGNECTVNTCASNVCVTTPVDAGTSCTDDGVCSGASVMCVECVSGAQCAAPTPICDPSTNTCIGCAGDTDCGGATPFCDPSARVCVACLGASDCDDGNECTVNGCSAGECSSVPAIGVACEGGICTPAGMCAPVAVEITAPSDGATVGTTTPTISGTGTPGATVVVSVDGEVVGMTTVGADGTWSVPVTTPLSEGAHTASASMATANGTATDMSTFVVDTETELSIVAPADGSTIFDATPNIWGTGEPGATVVVTVDGDEVGTATVGADGRWVVFVTTPLDDGEHTARARSTDAVGNTAEAESTFTVETAGTVAITEPPNGSTVANTTPTIEGTAAPGATVVVVLETEDGPVALGTVTADASGNWSLPITEPLDEGQQTVTATATDSDGRVGSDSTTFFVDVSTFVTIDTVDPTTGVITGTGEPGSTVVVTIDGEDVGTTTVGEDGTWQVDAGPLSPGRREIEATATDPAGNSATARRVVDVESPMVDAGPTPTDGGIAGDGGPTADPGTTGGGLAGGALCATSAPGGRSQMPLALLALIGLALARRRRRR